MEERVNLDGSSVYKFKLESTHRLFDELKKRAKQANEPVFKLTERSIDLFRRSKVGQGLAGVIDLETGEVDLIPAYNKDDGKTRDDFYYEEERGGKKVKINYRAISPEPLGSNTGIVHSEALRLLRKNDKPGKMLGFGVFKGGNDFPLQLRNVSASVNTLTIEYAEEFLLWSYVPFVGLYANPITNISRAIPREITQDLMATLLHDLPVTDQKNEINTGKLRSIVKEKTYLESSQSARLQKLKENLALSIYENPDIAKRIVTLLVKKNEYGSYDQELKTLMLIAASAAGLTEAVNDLIRAGADPNRKDSKNNSPLMFATTNEQENIKKLLIQCGAKPLNEPEKEKIAKDKLNSSLFNAVKTNNIDLTRLSLEQGADITVRNSQGDTVLITAAKEGYTDLLRLLMADERTDVNAKNNFGRTALIIAAEYSYSNIVKILLADERTNVNANLFRTALIIAAEHNDSNIVKILLADERTDVYAKDNLGRTALMIAAEYGNPKIVKILLADKRKNVNARNNHGETALMIAAAQANSKIVKILLTYEHTDVNAKEKNGWTALMIAAEHGNSNIVQILLADERTDVNAKEKKEKHGRTALMIAAEHGDSNIVNILLNDKKTDVNAKDNAGMTALMLMMSKKNINIAMVAEFFKPRSHDIGLDLMRVSTMKALRMLIDSRSHPKDIDKFLLSHLNLYYQKREKGEEYTSMYARFFDYPKSAKLAAAKFLIDNWDQDHIEKLSEFKIHQAVLRDEELGKIFEARNLVKDQLAKSTTLRRDYS